MSGKSTEVTAERRRQALRAHTDQLAGSIGAADRDAEVPTCPGGR